MLTTDPVPGNNLNWILVTTTAIQDESGNDLGVSDVSNFLWARRYTTLYLCRPWTQTVCDR
ncbi:MAG TPA: hypothetical protein O0X64_03365 [Methanocorpusculum sp.]|nr:hypothetical protein [Methanocorpusculum sp.]